MTTRDSWTKSMTPLPKVLRDSFLPWRREFMKVQEKRWRTRVEARFVVDVPKGYVAIRVEKEGWWTWRFRVIAPGLESAPYRTLENALRRAEKEARLCGWGHLWMLGNVAEGLEESSAEG